ncbi:hypothetical protein A0J48_026420 [Sphaerospermopsis aphanizomenoides BCCUSP55]|uniref:hypothetical protein n=1 Tax=Sphaerospermopsis aphanizomenoides TaxID=459663 RepID=UPI00190382F7|nr:hypothetical protein [Sphaerospermopsis aphanizomenoides]MBK1990998.1 hypothetical protein [Sphaerospermopsis aphanizomenoides BCCUSP55]
MSAGGVIGDLTQSLNCSGGKCDCCFQQKVQQEESFRQINDLSARVAKLEAYIAELERDANQIYLFADKISKAVLKFLKEIDDKF